MKRVIAIACGLLTLGAFVLLSRSAEAGSSRVKLILLALALTLTALAAYALVIALALLGFQCDESCTNDSWEHTPGAWQWTGQFIAAAIGFAAIASALVRAARNRFRRARWLAVLATAGFAAWAAFLAPLGDRFGI